MARLESLQEWLDTQSKRFKKSVENKKVASELKRCYKGEWGKDMREWPEWARESVSRWNRERKKVRQSS